MAMVTEKKQVSTEPSKEAEKPVAASATGLSAGEENASEVEMFAESLVQEATEEAASATSSAGPDAEQSALPAAADGNTQVVPASMPGTPSEMSAVADPQAQIGRAHV